MMLFLLRCAFWLSIVYGSIFWSHGAFSWSDEGPKLAEFARTGAKGLVATAVSGVTGLCARHAEECLTDARRLTSLFGAAEPAAEPESKTARPAALAEQDQIAEATVPLPIPDPRRHIRDAKHPRTP